MHKAATTTPLNLVTGDCMVTGVSHTEYCASQLLDMLSDCMVTADGVGVSHTDVSGASN